MTSYKSNTRKPTMGFISPTPYWAMVRLTWYGAVPWAVGQEYG